LSRRENRQKEVQVMAESQAGFVIITDTASEARLKDVRAALEESGIDKEETENLARELAKRHVFARTKNTLASEERIATARGIVNKVSETEGRIIYQLDEAYVKKEKLDFTYQGQFWYDKKEEIVGADTEALRQRAVDLFADKLDLYTPSDITRLVQRMFTRHRSIQSVRRQGGVYFVPNSQAGLVKQVQDFCTRMKMRWIIYPTNADGGMKEAVLERMAERIKSELETICAEVTGLKQEKGGLTSRIAKARLQTLMDQIGQIREFCEALGATAEEIEAAASTAEIDLGLVKACGSVSVLAALANGGIVTGLVGQLAKKAYEDRPKARIHADALAALGSDLKAAAKRGHCVDASALDAIPSVKKGKS
jgi:hypothetical protein